MRKSTKLGRATLALGLAAAAAIASRTSAAQQEPSERGQQETHETRPEAAQPKTSTASFVEATFEVKKVDKKDGTLTLRGPSGSTLEMKAGPDVDVDKLRVGQKLDVSYLEEVAVGIGPAGGAAPKAAAATTQRGGVTARQAVITARITSIDRDHDTVNVLGPGGRTHTLRIDDPALRDRLASIKPGESLQITYTQAVAVSASPSNAPSQSPSKTPSQPK